MNEPITVKQAAEMLKVSSVTILNLVHRDQIPFTRVYQNPTRYLLTMESVEIARKLIKYNLSVPHEGSGRTPNVISELLDKDRFKTVFKTARRLKTNNPAFNLT